MKSKALTIFLVVDDVELTLFSTGEGLLELSDAVRCGQLAVEERAVHVLLHNLGLAEAEKLTEFVIAEDDGPLGLSVGYKETPICNNQPNIFIPLYRINELSLNTIELFRPASIKVTTTGIYQDEQTNSQVLIACEYS